ncbi:hypothetical protein FQA47_006114 [Oryzias melastigma]|uniref:Uncharacterized protein n=1 Tax=Oryzias melastigma TaxID=30732 RepID=A0A834C093_ORYME|nr:hypothetical protein FQA47_006114 [Oryzias melastigma]
MLDCISNGSGSGELWLLGFGLSVREMQTRADSPLHPQETLGFQLLPSAKTSAWRTQTTSALRIPNSSERVSEDQRGIAAPMLVVLAPFREFKLPSLHLWSSIHLG